MSPVAASPPISDDAVTVQSLGSGSSGNAFLIEYRQTALLLDCGVGIRTLTRALRERGRRLEHLDGVLTTHEHSDHICTLPRFAGLDVPILSTIGTRSHLAVPDRQWQKIAPDSSVALGGVAIWAMAVDHDAADPCGYLIEAGSTRVSIFTDLGCWRERLGEPVAASDLIVLEANHNHEMLRRGPYPIHLKRRVASSTGHLSNEDAADALARTLQRGGRAQSIWLAHLSETNNNPMIACTTVVEALRAVDVDTPVTALPRRAPGPVWSSCGPAMDAWQPTARETPPSQLALAMTIQDS